MEHHMSFNGQIFTPPPISGWSSYNQTSTATLSANNAINLYVAKSGTVNSDNCSGYYRAAPSTPYTIIANCTYNGVDINVADNLVLTPGLGFTDTTKLSFINPRFNTTVGYALCVSNFTNATSISSNVFSNQSAGVSMYPQPINQWWMLRDDGTNIHFYMSSDSQNNGSTWVSLYSVARTNFLTPSKIGLFWNARGNIDMNVTISSWQIINS
jgi:hypothetical protein